MGGHQMKMKIPTRKMKKMKMKKWKMTMMMTMKMTKVAPRLLMTRMTFKIWWRMQFIDFPLEIMIQTDLLHYKVLKSIKSLLLTLCCQKDRHRLLGKRQSNPIIIKSCWQDAVKVETEVFYPDQEDLQVLC